MLIRYGLRVDPRWDACADYAIRLLLEGLGLAGRRIDISSEVDLAYSAEKPLDLSDRALWVRSAAVPDWNSSTAAVAWSGEMPVLCADHPRESTMSDPDHIGEDIVYSTYSIVTGALEREGPKNAWGVPIGRDGRLGRAGVLERPVISMYCSYLAKMLTLRRQSELEQVPRWPMGKKYAIVLSHDVDKPFTRPPWAFYLRRLRTNLSHGAPRAAVYGLAQTAKVAAVYRMAKLIDPADDPNFCFEAWADLEASLSTASCFYVAVTTSADSGASPHDVNYDFRHPAVVAQLRRAVEAGWEVGLHASINASRIPDRLGDERARLEGVLGAFQVRGVRHHYWSLDPELPERTLWHHADAGLDYDSSFGLNDSPGFRRGMMWPFRPFDRDRVREVPILEVPPTLMDASIFRDRVTADEGRRQIHAHISQVRKFGGAAVLDWHLEQLNPARLHGAGPVLGSALAELADDGDVYWATPQEVADWWQTRRERIEASA